MTIKELDAKYHFSRTAIAKDSGVSYATVKNFINGDNTRVDVAARLINALPITPNERTALIETMFEPKEV